MPVVLRLGPYRFFFYSNEGMPPKAPHIHVRGGGGEAKISLEAPFEVLLNAGYSARDLEHLRDLVQQHCTALREEYHDYFA
ncbi:MAG: DUF4160 domain-containing protein [Desulfovibrionaceae bacterium]|nr:DUF4160 domain-containing protein [Desulfovibrionaceae bacterium]